MKKLALSSPPPVRRDPARPPRRPPRAPPVGSAAPDFSLTDADGKTHSLAEYKGKYVVLEWTNPGCPFVRKHYDSGNMPKLQAEYTKKGVVWLAIDSSAQGKEGYLAGARREESGRRANTRPPARCCSTRTARWAISTARPTRRTCSSSIPRARWSTRRHRQHRVGGQGRYRQGDQLRAAGLDEALAGKP